MRIFHSDNITNIMENNKNKHLGKKAMEAKIDKRDNKKELYI